uniref:CNH domain-containing protein n=1 Tax=Macrostomum lignano TaxID=282301 RepID=A0A1I8FDD8_9PLAT
WPDVRRKRRLRRALRHLWARRHHRQSSWPSWEPPMFSLHPMKALPAHDHQPLRPPKLRDKAISRPAAHDLLQHQFLANPALGKHLTVTLLRQFSRRVPARISGRGLLDELLAAAPDEEDDEDGAPAPNPPLPPSRHSQPEAGGRENSAFAAGAQTGGTVGACSGREPVKPPQPPPSRQPQQQPQQLDEGLRPPHRSGRPPLLASPPPAAPAKPKRPVSAEILGPTRTDDQQAADSSGDSLAAETADPGPPPTPPQRTSSSRWPKSAAGATAAASLERRWRGRRQTASPLAKWTNPAGCDLVFVGANEGLYYMSLDQLHDPTMVLLVRQRCLWLFGVPRHPASRAGCHAAANNPPSAKIPRTKAVSVSAAKQHPETAERWLACALPQSVLLLLHAAHLELLIRSGFKLPFVCVGVLRARATPVFPFRLLDLNKLDGQIELSPNDENRADEEGGGDQRHSAGRLNHVAVRCYVATARPGVRTCDTGAASRAASRTGNRLGTLSFEFTIEMRACSALTTPLSSASISTAFQAKSFLAARVQEDVEDRSPTVYRGLVGFRRQNLRG